MPFKSLFSPVEEILEAIQQSLSHCSYVCMAMVYYGILWYVMGNTKLSRLVFSRIPNRVRLLWGVPQRESWGGGGGRRGTPGVFSAALNKEAFLLRHTRGVLEKKCGLISEPPYLFCVCYCIIFSDARRGTQESAKSMSRTSKMSTQEALQILNLQKAEMKPDFVRKVRW